MTRPLNASLASITVAGKAYPLVSAQRCRTCSSPFRQRAEEETLAGKPWAQIVQTLPPEAGLSPRNVRDHFRRGHLPLHEPAVQEHLARRAEARGQVVAPAVDRLADHLEFAQTVVNRVAQRVQTRQVEPSVRDGLAAAAHLATFAVNDYNEGYLREVVRAMDAAAKKVMTNEMFDAFWADLVCNPVMAGPPRHRADAT